MRNLTIVDLTSPEELSPATLSRIAGGMSCENALTVAQVYTVIGDVFLRGGDTQHASYYYGMASGVTSGGC